MTLTITRTADDMLDLAIKVERVLESCTDEKQLRTAFRYAKLVEKRLRIMRGSASSLTDVDAFSRAMGCISNARGRSLAACVKKGPKHSKARTRFWEINA